MKSIRNKKIEISDNAKSMMNEFQIDSLAVNQALKNGDVDFSKSITDRKLPCQTYHIDFEYTSKPLALTVKRCDSIAMVEDIKF